MRLPVATAATVGRLKEAAAAGSERPAPEGESAARLAPRMRWKRPTDGFQLLQMISRRLKDGCQRPWLSGLRNHSARQVAAWAATLMQTMASPEAE